MPIVGDLNACAMEALLIATINPCLYGHHGDVATPFTTLRYTHNWQGALGFIITQRLVADMTMKPQYTLPGLDGFYMIGQWVKGFGVPNAAFSGKDVIRELCKADGKRFRAD